MELTSAVDPTALDGPDPAASEADVRRYLLDYFGPTYKERVENYVETLLSKDSYIGRFDYLRSVVGPYVFAPASKVLVSGCGAGSEMMVARDFGFGPVFGVEVEQVWVSACEMRLRHLPDTAAYLYDGERLPFADAEFDVITSGHVVEHTRDPESYLRECARVLKPYGYISLEFPNRFHRTELHTGLPSFEWLPSPIRNSIVRALSGRHSPLKPGVKERYRAITDTDLKQISMGGVRRMLKRTGHKFSILHSYRVLPGVTRCVIRKS